jgi:hypothetical protein
MQRLPYIVLLWGQLPDRHVRFKVPYKRHPSRNPVSYRSCFIAHPALHRYGNPCLAVRKTITFILRNSPPAGLAPLSPHASAPPHIVPPIFESTTAGRWQAQPANPAPAPPATRGSPRTDRIPAMGMTRSNMTGKF